jgi:hypothetical protein
MSSNLLASRSWVLALLLAALVVIRLDLLPPGP